MANSRSNAEAAITHWFEGFHGRSYEEMRPAFFEKRPVTYRATDGLEYKGVVWVEPTGAVNPLMRAVAIVYRPDDSQSTHMLRGVVGLMSSGRFKGRISFESPSEKFWFWLRERGLEFISLAAFVLAPFAIYWFGLR